MEKYYYGTSKSNLQGLYISNQDNDRIYMAKDRINALIYSTIEYIDLFIDDNDGNIKFLNIYPHLFENLYKNKIGYIYSVLSDDFQTDAPKGKKPIASLYFTKKDIVFTSREEVNIYDEFLKLKKTGKFQIVEKDDIDKDYIDDLSRHFSNKFNDGYMTKKEIEYFDTYFPGFILKK